MQSEFVSQIMKLIASLAINTIIDEYEISSLFLYHIVIVLK